MDPVTLAATATTFLLPYLAKAGKIAIENIAKEMPDTVGVLWDKIAAKFQDKPAAAGAAQELASKADDEINQQTFKLQLQKALENDPAFAEEFESLFKKAQASVNINVQGSGAVATNGGVAAGQGGIAVGGNVEGNIIMGNNNTVGNIQKKP
ncbi:MAG: hypothetical protein M1282_02925 [Chloroflexi bacterium]|nr:hypothetical protein [Chloroflexota bacterium]